MKTTRTSYLLAAALAGGMAAAPLHAADVTPAEARAIIKEAYEMPSSLLSANPLNRYLLNSPMLPQFKRDPDGGLTLLVQHDSPGADLEANWLPAPKGPFVMAMRLYLPKPEALTGAWTAPPAKKLK